MGTAWKFFVYLDSMKYNQTNTKPFCTPRKLMGGLTHPSEKPEPQNSAGIHPKRKSTKKREPGI